MLTFHPAMCNFKTLAYLLPICVFLICGCEPGADSASNETPQVTPSDLSENQNENTPGEGSKAYPKSPWVGNWDLAINEQTVELRPFMLQIAEQSGRRIARMLDKSPIDELKDWKLVDVKFKDDDIILIIENGPMKLIFEGTMQEGMILGSFFPEADINPSPARLLKTDRENLNGVDLEQMIDGVPALEKADTSKNSIEQLAAFAKQNPQSPLVFLAFNSRMTKAVDAKLPVEQIQKMADEMAVFASQWGMNIAAQNYFDVLEMTLDNPKYRTITVETFASLQKIVGEEPNEAMQNNLDEFQARIHLTSQIEADQKKAVTAIQKTLQEKPFDLKLAISLAEHFEKKKQSEQALKIYSRIAVLPGLAYVLKQMKSDEEGVYDVVAKTRSLWKGKDEDFEHYLDEVYEREAFFFAKEEKLETELRDGRRVTLVEMFTGAVCPPCVAGDLALGGVEKMLPAPNFIAVRYHQHIPGPDPLTVSHGEGRLGYYNGRGTPLVTINGRTTPNMGGQIFHAESRYQLLFPRIKNLLSQISLVKLELKASLEGDVIKIDAKAENIPDLRKNAKLRLLIVDPLIKFPAGNGIRFHEMIVRDAPGGIEGVDVKDGAAGIKIDRSISELQTEILEGLKKYEENRSITFDFLPVELKRVRVIAFVQDDDTREILQAAISPVLTVVP